MDAVGIRVEGLVKRFSRGAGGEVAAVRGISLDVAPGRLVTLLGPSGCGKTTTLRMIAGFETADAGRILFGDRDVTRLPANRRDIGFVFQSYALFPHLTVAENVAYGLRVRQRSEAEIAREVAEVLALVGLAGYERQFPHQLSGGQQQRVALARAIVIRPQVLLFDEPLSNLDAKLRVQMREEIRRLQERLSITTVYVTHDQDEAMAISDRIVVMDRGEAVQVGTAEDLYARPASAFVAQFVGRLNVLQARVREASGPAVTVDVNGHALRAESPAGRGLAVGAVVRLAIRPETIDLERPDGGLPEGRVESRTFLGEKVEYRVAWAGASLTVCAYDPIRRGSFAPGDRVGIRLPALGVRILPPADAE